MCVCKCVENETHLLAPGVLYRLSENRELYACSSELNLVARMFSFDLAGEVGEI